MKIKEYKSVLRSNRQPMMKETATTYNIDGRKQFSDPATIARFMLDEVGTREAGEEYVYILCLDTKLHLTGLFEASHGSVNGSIFPIREILQKALLLGAVSIILTHNHPSGDAMPSNDDISATKRLKEGCFIIGISLLDHVVTAGITGEYTSMKEMQII